jgi:23S rRNA (uridine2552-2'-O)-methyltransferase
MSSKRWLQEHFKDPYVKKAQEQGYISRAAYKLLEIQEKDKLIKPGMTVVDLGAAPGSWCQVLKQLVGLRGRVIGMDILPVTEVSGIDFIQGDFTEDSCLEALLACLDGAAVDLVLSDMAPNMSGHKSIDQPRVMHLIELALDFAVQVLAPGGAFITKGFHGSGLEEYVTQMRQYFKQVKFRKPPASRSRSAEIYLLGLDFKAD